MGSESEPVHTIRKSAGTRSAGQILFFSLRTSHGTGIEEQNPVFMGVLTTQAQSRSRRRIPLHNRLEHGHSPPDTKPGPHVGGPALDKTHASFVPLASGSHTSFSAVEVNGFGTQPHAPWVALVLHHADGSATPRAR